MSSTPSFVDECVVHARAGAGGNGAMSMRREAHVPRGGPDGGNGGRGGNVVFQADHNTSSLIDIHRRPHRRAENGQPGSSQRKDGAWGEDLILHVPVGTVITTDDGALVADLTAHGQQVVALRGGRGGRGNATLSNKWRRAPKFAELGEKTDDQTFKLELKLIADVGLVGFPSAGKSSLIRAVSSATPRVEAWPFTTLTPHLGVMRAGDTPDGTPIDVVLADVPGLIPGASEGKGLGIQFLRHIERCRLLLHVVDAANLESDRDPITDVKLMRGELEAHNPELLERDNWVVLNKVDLEDGQQMVEMTRDQFESQGFRVFPISALDGTGLDALRYALGAAVHEARDEAPQPVAPASDPDTLVISPVQQRRRTPIEVVDLRDNDDVDADFEVTTAKVRRWVQMLPTDNPEALRYLQSRMRRGGVDRALALAGARHGDDVLIGDVIFGFDPELKDLPAEERAQIEAESAASEIDGDEIDGDEATEADAATQDSDATAGDAAPEVTTQADSDVESR